MRVVEHQNYKGYRVDPTKDMEKERARIDNYINAKTHNAKRKALIKTLTYSERKAAGLIKK